MVLHAHRHPRPEWLVSRLADQLAAAWPKDPFARVRVVVGSRGMERWLRAELATRHRSLSGVDFWFPGRAFDAAMDAVFACGPVVGARPLQHALAGHQGVSPLQVCRAIRAHLDKPAFAGVRRYLGDVPGEGGHPVAAREFAFAREVAAVIERLHYDRPDQALSWIAHPQAASDADGEGAPWLAQVLSDLARSGEGPAQRLARLRALPPTGGHPPLHLFGLSSLRPGDKLRVQALSGHMDVHLFALVPSMQWWADIRSRAEVRRALRKVSAPALRAQLIEELQQDNPFLAAYGAPSRDLQLWLEEVGYTSDDEEVPAPSLSQTRLARLQRFIDDAAEASALPALLEEPSGAERSSLPSLELHVCHGALRQCEALRDELLRRFAADDTLEPRHILVMTPEPATYAPLIAAVLGRSGDDVPAIPVYIADLGLRDTNPVAALLLDLVGLIGERMSASRLLAFLAHEPVRHRFRVGDEDLAALREMVVASGLRWAWDADDRAAHDQPALDQNTLRFALERLALGTLLPDPGGQDALPAAAGFGPAVPLDLPSRDQYERFGVLAALCDGLRQRLRVFAEPARPGAWRSRLIEALDALGDVPEERAWQRQQVLATLAELLPDEAGVPEGSPGPEEDEGALPLDASALQALLADAFTLPRGGDRPATGAVTVSSMEPMRSVPFRIIAMVGMDDGAFPRSSRPRAWDPFARPRADEHDRRTLDRHLFLESLLCARDALLVFGRGFESGRGRAVPLSVIIEELREHLPAPLVRTHPLQPWSPAAYADPARLPFGAAALHAAEARLAPPRWSGLWATAAGAPWPAGHPLPAASPVTLSAGALARDLENAPAALLERRLGLRLSRRELEVADREPIELGSLDAWQVRHQLLEAGRRSSGQGVARQADTRQGDTGQGDAGPFVFERVLARHRALGQLPLEAGGEALLAEELAGVRDILARSAALGGEALAAPAYRCVVGREPAMVVSAAPPEARRDGEGCGLHVWLTPSSAPGDRLLLEAFCTLLVAVAAGEGVREAHLVARAKSHRLAAPAAAEARAWLEGAAKLWQRAQAEPVPLVPVFSRALAAAALKAPEASPEELVTQCLSAWFAEEGERAALSDEATEGLFGSWGEAELVRHARDFVLPALALWSPVLASLGGR